MASTPSSYMDWVKDSAFWQAVVVDDDAAFLTFLDMAPDLQQRLLSRTFTDQATCLAVAAKNGATKVAHATLSRAAAASSSSSKETTEFSSSEDVGVLEVVVNATDCHGNTALHEAVRVGSDTVFDALVDCEGVHVEVSMANAAGKMPLHMACQLGRERMALALFRRAPHVKDVVDAIGFTPLGYARRGVSATEAHTSPFIRALVGAGCVPDDPLSEPLVLGTRTRTPSLLAARAASRAAAVLRARGVLLVGRAGAAVDGGCSSDGGGTSVGEGGHADTFALALQHEQRENVALVALIRGDGTHGHGQGRGHGGSSRSIVTTSGCDSKMSVSVANSLNSLNSDISGSVASVRGRGCGAVRGRRGMEPVTGAEAAARSDPLSPSTMDTFDSGVGSGSSNNNHSAGTALSAHLGLISGKSPSPSPTDLTSAGCLLALNQTQTHRSKRSWDRDGGP